MTSTPDPKEVLDAALAQPPGLGTVLTFPGTGDRERFRWRCYAAMSGEARASRRELEPTSAGWGKHPWTDVVVQRWGFVGLWIGRRVDNAVTVVEDVSQNTSPLGPDPRTGKIMLLAKYVSGDDVCTSDLEFLRMVCDRINEDIAGQNTRRKPGGQDDETT